MWVAVPLEPTASVSVGLSPAAASASMVYVVLVSVCIVRHRYATMVAVSECCQPMPGLPPAVFPMVLHGSHFPV